MLSVGSLIVLTTVVLVVELWRSFPQRGWHLHQTEYFSMHLPNNLKLIYEGGTDSIVHEFKSDTMSMSFDYGFWSSDMSEFENEKSFRSHHEIIGLVRAKLVTVESDERWLHAVYFPSSIFSRGMKLSLLVSCKDQEDCRYTEDIFRSVRFNF